MGNCSSREEKGGDKYGSSGNASRIKNDHAGVEKDSFGGKSADQSLSFRPPAILKVSEIVRPDNYRIKGNKS
jgi:hypothetical protein